LDEELDMSFHKRWWLGFLGLIGIYKLPDVLAAYSGDKGPIEYLYLTWLIWLLYFVPQKQSSSPSQH
jgi:hypothetical protein